MRITIALALFALHAAFAVFVLRRLRSQRITRVCCKCKRQLDGTSNRPTGEPLPIGPRQSHGVCTECVRAWGEELGLSEENINELEATAKQAA